LWEGGTDAHTERTFGIVLSDSAQRVSKYL